MDVSDIFYFFLVGDGGRGGVRGRREGGEISFLLRIPERGGGLQEGEGPRGREGVCGELGNGREGLIIFFSGPKCPPSCGTFSHLKGGHLQSGKEKGALRLIVLGLDARWGGGLPHEGVGVRNFVPSSKVCFPWVSLEGTWDVPGMLPGCPGHLGVFRKI